MSENDILVEVKDHIALVTMNRPEVRNCLNGNLLTSIKETFIRLEMDRDIWVPLIYSTTMNNKQMGNYFP